MARYFTYSISKINNLLKISGPDFQGSSNFIPFNPKFLVKTMSLNSGHFGDGQTSV
jgi:hypothetical protein